jgi:hypothetical protein
LALGDSLASIALNIPGISRDVFLHT